MGKYKVWLYHDLDGRSPVKDFIDSANNNQRGKIIKQFLYLTEFGVTQQNPFLKKLIGTPIWEVRILGKDNIRLFCADSKRGVAILHIFFKKRQKTHASDISIALKRLRLI